MLINLSPSEQVVFLRGTISVLGDRRVPWKGTPGEPWATECRLSCQLAKEQSFLASSWGCVPGSMAGKNRVTREPRTLPGMLEGTQGTVPQEDEHCLGPLLSLRSAPVFNHPLHVQKTFTITSSILSLS